MDYIERFSIIVCMILCLFIREGMLRSGLLVLNSKIVYSGDNVLSTVIESCVKTVRNILYVHLVSYNESLAAERCSKPAVMGSVRCTQSVRHFVFDFYTRTAGLQQSLEVRFLLSNICSKLPQFPVPQQRLQHGYEVILTDLSLDLHQTIADYAERQFPVNHAVNVIQVASDASSNQTNSSGSRLVLN